jgi:hypothetical protein
MSQILIKNEDSAVYRRGVEVEIPIVIGTKLYRRDSRTAALRLERPEAVRRADVQCRQSFEIGMCEIDVFRPAMILTPGTGPMPGKSIAW